MPRIGPVVMTTVGDEFIESAQIDAVLWEGATTAGDTAEIADRNTGALLYPFRAVGAQTWEGIGKSMAAPNGFKVTKLSAGRLLVYLAEP